VAKKTKKNQATSKRRLYSNEDLKTLKAHSKAKTPVDKIAKLMKRSGATLRQKARAMGLSLGHRR
jgi:DNA-binding transcriptional MerR regulator